MRIIHVSLIAVLTAGVAACTGEQGEPGATGTGIVASSEDEPAGANCANGGVKFSWGADDNGNGALDAGEIDGTKYICNGATGSNGHQSLVSTTPEPAGTNCTAGGVRVDHGIDDNNNGTLDAGEIDGTSYVCAPLASLVVTTVEPAGNNCANGGTKITAGVDDNNNGALDAGEVDSTTYACNGANGLKSLVATANEPAGAICTNGGTKITYGLDDNNNNILDPAEVDGTAYVCGTQPANQPTGNVFNSLPGASTGASIRGAGDACGTQVTVGASNVVVHQLAALNTMNAAGNIKFVILDHQASDAVLLTTASTSFAADANGPTWKSSPTNLNFTLTAGHTYCISGISDAAGSWTYDQTGETAFGLTSTVQNPNVTNFASPTISSHGAADCGIKIFE